MDCKLIKVCGMREPENILAVKALGINMIGFVFYNKSPRYVRSIDVHAGVISNMAKGMLTNGLSNDVKTVGVFVDEMPQTVITHVCNYKLDYIQLHGNESATYIDNLKRALVPDLLPDVKIIKALSIREADDIKRWREYQGHVDMLVFDTKCKCVGGSGEQFDWNILQHYDGDIPFLLSGGIDPNDAEQVKKFQHPMCIGVDLNSRFEDAPALKNVEKLREFIRHFRDTCSAPYTSKKI